MGFEHSGRRPQPTAMKVLRGNPGKRKLNEAEPVPPDGEIKKPAEMSASAGVFWDELAPICMAMGTLTVADVRAFASLCGLQATFTQIEQTKGTAAFDAKLERETAHALRPYYEYFGLTPGGRAKLSVQKKPDQPVSKWAGALT